MARGNLRAIAAMLGAVATFSVMDALLKQLMTRYASPQVACIRAFASLPFIVASAAWTRTWHELRPRNWRLHLARGVLGILMMITFLVALRQMSMADTYSIYMAAPLLVAALSVPVFGDRVPARRWAAIGCGFLGVLVVLRPTGAGLTSSAGLVAAVSALCYAINVLTVRSLGRTDSSRSMVAWYLVLLGTGAAALAWPEWRPIAGGDWRFVAAVGMTGAIAQYLFTEAFRLAPPTVVIPFEYTAIVWAMTIDWVVWRTAPGLHVMVGAGIVVASGLYVLYDERRAAYARTDAPGAATGA